MTLRPGLALSAVLAAVALGVPAHAAPAPVACKLLTDGTGDAALTPATPNIGSLDILSADIASGPKNMVGVLRLASLASDPQTSGGSTYVLSWSANGTPQKLTLTIYVDGTMESAFTKDGAPGTSSTESAVVALDKSTSTITWTVARKSNPLLKAATKAKPVKFTGLTASAQPATNVRVQGSTFSGSYSGDKAENGKTYVDSTRTCVKGT